MTVYTRLKATALRLITKYGEQSVWRQNVAIAADPDKPWLPGGTETKEHKVRIAYVPMGGSVQRLIKMMKDGDVETGTTLGYMPPVKFKPSILDTIVRSNGTVMRIVSFDPIAPNAEGAVVYELELRE